MFWLYVVLLAIVYNAISFLVGKVCHMADEHHVPTVQPPGIVFPIVWACLYALLAFTTLCSAMDWKRQKYAFTLSAFSVCCAVALYVLLQAWVVTYSSACANNKTHALYLFLPILTLCFMHTVALIGIGQATVALATIPLAMWLLFAFAMTYEVASRVESVEK